MTHYIEKMYKDERTIRYDLACGIKLNRPLAFNEGTVTSTDVTRQECLDALARKAHLGGPISK